MAAARTTDPAGRSPVRRLFAQPIFWRWAVANLFARLPLTMNLLVLVLVGEQVDGSLSSGALLAGTVTVASGLTAQWRGRQLDHTDLRRGLGRDLLAGAVAIIAIVVAAESGVPIWVLGLLAAAQGVALAAVLGGFRTMLVVCVSADDIEPANAVDAVFVEVAFIAGPAGAGLLALLMAPTRVLVVMAAALLIATVLLLRLPTRSPVPGRTPSGPPPLRTRGATPVYLLVLGMGVPLGMWEAAMPAKVAELGFDPASTGPFLAIVSVGSGLAGIAAANMRDPLRLGRLMAGLLMLMWAVMYVPTGLATSAVVFGIALFLFGVPIAPLNALAGLAFQRIVAVERQAEGFSLYPAMILIGVGVGQLLTGLLLRVTTPTTLVTTIGLIPAVLGVLVLLARMRRSGRGLSTGVGFGHDPDIADPASYAPTRPASAA